MFLPQFTQQSPQRDFFLLVNHYKFQSAGLQQGEIRGSNQDYLVQSVAVV